MNLEIINKWLDEEYGCSYTRLEELHDFYFEKYCDLQQKNKQLLKKAGNDNLISKINLTPETATIQASKVNINDDEQTCDILLKSSVEENKKLKDNWNKLKEYIRKNIIYDDVGMKILDPSPLEDYIQELEQGSDSNEI